MFALQIFVCDLMRPIIFVPVLGYGTYGVLNGVFTPFSQLQLAAALLLAVVVSTTALFEYRHHATLPPDSRLNLPTRIRVVIFIFRFFIGCGVAAGIQVLSNDQEVGRPFWVENAPCQLDKSSTDPSVTFFFTIDGVLTAVSILVTCAVIPLVEMIFYGIHSNLQIRSPSSTISSQSRRLQINFLRALFIQECAPVLIAYPEPVFYISFSCLTWVMYLDLNNLAILLIASHGVFASLAVLLVNRPYREFLLNLITIFVLQLYICDMMRPIVLFPILGYGTYAGALLLAVFVSTTALFEYRHHATLPPDSRLNFSTRFRVLSFIIRFVFAFSASAAIQNLSNDQELGRRFWVENGPCRLEKSATDPSITFFFTIDGALNAVSVLVVCVAIPLAEMIFYGIDSYLRIRSPSSTISTQSRKLQLNFLRALFIQFL
ncbi:unnamed protein product [Caenorhabditis auriculariae]|uniref:Uncharacterized protein n=1 Tax=Caenorhabditis auriculariae TaxID=2777116 RepID=A0A8S1HSM5_9PELO|nr:unnamed protein product [Caenorhabditis auriculariae]